MCAYVLSDDVRERLGHMCRPLCEEQLELRIDEIDIDVRIDEALLVRHQLLFYEGKGERCYSTAVLEDDVDTIDEKE